MLRPEEVEQLVCGCPTLDLVELRKVTYYDGFKQEDITIQYFWEVKDEHMNLWRFMVIHQIDTVNSMSIFFFEKAIQFNNFFRIEFFESKKDEIIAMWIHFENFRII